MKIRFICSLPCVCLYGFVALEIKTQDGLSICKETITNEIRIEKEEDGNIWQWETNKVESGI